MAKRRSTPTARKLLLTVTKRLPMATKLRAMRTERLVMQIELLATQTELPAMARGSRRSQRRLMMHCHANNHHKRSAIIDQTCLPSHSQTYHSSNHNPDVGICSDFRIEGHQPVFVSDGFVAQEYGSNFGSRRRNNKPLLCEWVRQVPSLGRHMLIFPQITILSGMQRSDNAGPFALVKI